MKQLAIQDANSRSSKPSALSIARRLQIVALITFGLVSLASTFQLAIIINRVYKPEHGAISTLLLTLAYAVEVIMLAYVFANSWLVRRPTLVIISGVICLVFAGINIIVLIASMAQIYPPLAVGSTATRIKVYFGFKTSLFILAQIFVAYMGWTGVYTLPRMFKLAKSYFAMWDDEEEPDVSPPSTSSYLKDDNRFETGQMLQELDDYSPGSAMLSDSRDTQSM